MKKILKKRIEKIHAVKTNKTLNSKLSESSYEAQLRLKLILDDMGDNDDFSKVIDDVNRWAGSNPIATDREVNDLM